MNKAIKIADIIIEGGETQQREKISLDIVAEYAESMRCGAKFPPVTLFFDGAQYWLADGFHRYHATKEVPALDILADVQSGTKRDARLFSAGANGAHGQRLSNADKRRSVLVLLMDKEWCEWSDDKIAKHCHVTRKYVHQLRSEKSVTKLQNSPQTQQRRGVEKSPQAEKYTAAPAEPQPAPEATPKDDEAGMHAEMLADAMEALHEENDSLRNQLAAMLFTGDEEEKQQFLRRLDDLTEENRQLKILNNGLVKARDRVMTENASMRKQLTLNAKRLKAVA